MEFGIRDIYEEEDRPRAAFDEELEQADQAGADGAMSPKKRGRKSSKTSYSRRPVKKVDSRAADVAAESDY